MSSTGHDSHQVIVAPSILSADFGSLETDIREVDSAGADWIHIDVMDGSFVPPITFGDNVVKLAKRCTKKFLDVHLMVSYPERHIELFAKAGSDRLIIHQEATANPGEVLKQIKKLGIANGLAIKPDTSVDVVKDLLPVTDLLLVMTVNPGWGGQSFIGSTLEKVKQVKQMVLSQGLSTLIEVDGGINKDTAKDCVAAGANVLVAGSFIFGQRDRRAAISALRGY